MSKPAVPKLPAKPRLDNLVTIKPLTDGQRQSIEGYKSGEDLMMYGSAGTGKTFIALQMALEDVLTKETPYDKVVIVRSNVATRDPGALPGELEDKEDPYKAPYRSIINDLFQSNHAWDAVLAAGIVEFRTTSYIRGITIKDAVVLVDEIQNMRYDEIRSAITRTGDHTRLILAGDTLQTDLVGREKEDAIEGFDRVRTITGKMTNFTHVRFTPADIVRSGRVRQYLILEERENQ